MIAQIWIIQVVLAVAAAIPGHELVPEKYLKPRDFNYHPYTDVGVSASLKKAISPSSTPLESDPFHILDKLRRRESRDHSRENLLYFPIPSQRTIIAKKIDTNDLPKNYAFTYTVKDHLSGDDFSHSQAHNGKATKGQYRVKLPDGRTQIVSYTADHKGYRADVQYEDQVLDHAYVRPVYSQNEPVHAPENSLHKAYRGYQNEIIPKYQYVPVESATAVTPTLATKPVQTNYVSDHVTLPPAQIRTGGAVLKLLVKHHGSPTPTAVPQYYKPVFLPQYVSTVIPYQKDNAQYVTTTASPQHFAASTATPQVSYVPSTPLYRTDGLSAVVAKHYQSYPVASTTISPPEHAVVVTPRPVHHQSDVKALEPPSFLYSLLK